MFSLRGSAVGPGFVTITRKMHSQKDEPCILHWCSNWKDTSVYLYENLTQESVLKVLCQKCKKSILKKKSENRGYLSAILSSLRFLTRQGISFLAKSSLSSGPVLRHLTESSITTSEINLWYFITSPLLMLLRIQEIRQFVIFSEMYMLVYVCAHILLFFYLLVW